MNKKQYAAMRRRAERYLVRAVYHGVPAIRDDGARGLTGFWRFPATVPPSKQEAAADYAELAPLRWRIEVEAVFRDGRDQYNEVVEIETSQALRLDETTPIWLQALDEARGRGNPKHHWFDRVRATPLVSGGN